jgi:3-hydroxybutyryl-CoA dehydrogenase
MTADISYWLIDTGGSRSFPEGDAFLTGATETAKNSDCVVIIGKRVDEAFAKVKSDDFRVFLLELGHEYLGSHIGEQLDCKNDRILGFNRFRLGSDKPSDLIELVAQSTTDGHAKDTAASLFEQRGFKTAVCHDRAGRIVDRLIRPYFNAALDRLDEGLASAADLDRALKLGLGYPRGPIEWLETTGLAAHYEVSMALYQALGDPAYLPARRAQVAASCCARQDGRNNPKGERH